MSDSSEDHYGHENDDYDHQYTDDAMRSGVMLRRKTPMMNQMITDHKMMFLMSNKVLAQVC